MYTRTQYVAGECTHEEYWHQFAPTDDSYVARRVRAVFDVEKIQRALDSGDEHLNTVPLAAWDAIASQCCNEISRLNKEINGVRAWSFAEGVCAAKCYAVRWARQEQEKSDACEA